MPATLLALRVGIALGPEALALLDPAEIGDESGWRLIYTVVVALFALGVGRLLGSDEVLVVFAAGVAFVQVVSAEDREEEQGQEAVSRFFAIPIFTLLGTAIS